MYTEHLLTTPVTRKALLLRLPEPIHSLPRITHWDYLAKFLAPDAPLGCDDIRELKYQGCALIDELTQMHMNPNAITKLVKDLEAYLSLELNPPKRFTLVRDVTGMPEMPTWNDYLMEYHPEHLITLKCARIIGNTDQLDTPTGRTILEALVGRKLLETAERQTYQGFPCRVWQLNNDYLGYTEF